MILDSDWILPMDGRLLIGDFLVKVDSSSKSCSSVNRLNSSSSSEHWPNSEVTDDVDEITELCPESPSDVIKPNEKRTQSYT